MLSTNEYVRNGMTAGGIWKTQVYDSEAELTRMVNGMVQYRKDHPLPDLGRGLLGGSIIRPRTILDEGRFNNIRRIPFNT